MKIYLKLASRFGSVFLVSAILLTSFVFLWAQSTEPPAITTASSPPYPPPLSGALPYDVDVPKVRALVAKGEIPTAHREFDELAWQAFIALNWPAEPDGKPSTTKTIADKYSKEPRVWDFYIPSDKIFLPEGARPEPWSGKIQTSAKYRWKAAWREHTVSSSNLEAFSGPLVDQNGNWVRYQIRVNKTEFDYILANELYSIDGQVKFSQRTENNQVMLPANEGKTKHGAIEIKLAWKELGPKDDHSRFFIREIVAELSEPTGPDGKIPTRKIIAGLVGMHISMKTESSPEWIWATFEHIDNTRVNTTANGSKTNPSFYNPNQPQPINVLPAANAVVNPTTGNLEVVTDTSTTPDKWVEHLTKTPVQVQRVDVPTQLGLNPLDKTLGEVAKSVNAKIQAQLRMEDSVFQYFELIDAQWPVHPNALAFAGGANSAPESITFKTPGNMVPVFLVNTTMETYFQKGSQEAGALEQDDRLAAGSPSIDTTRVIGTESCVGCHYSSGVATGYKRDLATGKTIVDANGYPVPIFGENNHFGKTGGANFSWMLQLEPKLSKLSLDDPNVLPPAKAKTTPDQK